MISNSYILGFLLLFNLSCHHRDKQRVLSAIELDKLRQEFNLPKDKTFVLDTGYFRYLFTLDTAKYADAIHNHYQPIQALFYNHSGRLISFHINCYAGLGVDDGKDLNWNQQNAFAVFVPRSVVPLDTILPLNKHLQFIRTFDNKPIDTTGFSEFDYIVIIHWEEQWRAKDCKNLFKIVNDNISRAVGKKVDILYVNNDNHKW